MRLRLLVRIRRRIFDEMPFRPYVDINKKSVGFYMWPKAVLKDFDVID